MKTIITAMLVLVSVTVGGTEQCLVHHPNQITTEGHEASTAALKVPTTVGLFRVRGFVDEMDRAKVIRAARQMESEFKSLRLDVEVTGHILESACSPFLTGDCFREAKQLASYSHYHMWGGSSSRYCGMAYMDGKKAWTSSKCFLSTLIHEQAHNFGASHTGQGDYEYGWDTWMGSGSRRESFSAVSAGQMGVDVHITAGPGLFFIASPYSTLLEGESHIATFGDYSVSQWRGRLVVSTGHAQQWLIADLSKGQSVRIDGTTVEFVEEREGVIKTRIGDRLLDATFPQPEETTYADGLYISPDAKSQGVMVLGRTIYWLTWDKDMRPLWYWGRNGTLWSARKRGSTVTAFRAGSYHLTSEGLRYHTDELGRGAFQMSMLARSAPDPLSGIWGLGGGRGLVLQAQGDHLYGFLLDYGPDKSTRIDRELRWYLISGPVDGELSIMQPFDGYPGVDLEPRSEIIGTTRIENGIWLRDGTRLRRIQ